MSSYTTTAATMTSSVPQRSSRPPAGPLPALPISRTRKPLPDLPDAPDSPPPTSTPFSATPARSQKRSVTASGLPTPRPVKTESTPAIPTLKTVGIEPSSNPPSSSPPSSAIPTPGKAIRKTTSIGHFPLPPKSNPRVSSLPPSPLSTSASTSDANAPSRDRSRRESARLRGSDVGAKRPKARSSGYGLRSRASNASMPGLASSPSLLNGTADSNLISGADRLLPPPSPPRSRSSSANDSLHTDGTQFEEEEGMTRGRPKSQDTLTDKYGKDGKGNVIVSVRVRPDASGGEAKADGEWMVDGRRSLISYNGREGGEYRYDNVFSPHDQNARVYDCSAKRLVRRVMEGYHGTVFAYGMTGTGKTFSMQGTASSPGVIPSAISDIFSYIRENPNREFLLRVSYLEIYNEKIYDLLSQSSPGQGQVQQEEIKLREDAKRGVYATPLKEEIVQSPNQLLRVIARGDVARRTGSTQFNARSSRSHAVVQIVVESRERTQTHGAHVDADANRKSARALAGGVLVSTLSLIDLAGSERAAENKERRQEGAHINKSLLTLGTVIARLSGDDENDKEEGGKTEKDKEKGLKHLPYRDSKLTRLLQPALSGNSLVSILCTIQLSSAGSSAATSGLHTGETLNTLKFASRAKNNIVSHAKRNESNPHGGDAGSRALLDRYRIEIQELRAQLDQQNKEKEEAERADEADRDRQMEEELERQERTRHEEQMLEMQLARTALKERISHLNRLILSSKSLGVNSNSGRFSSQSTQLINQNRMSAFSTNDFGRPVSVRSLESAQSNGNLAAMAARQSLPAAMLEVPPATSNAEQTVSVGSMNAGVLPAASPCHLVEDESALVEVEEDVAPDDDEAETTGPDGESEASLAQQNRMLQADLCDKNRYIATLEKRLLQARRTSHSRVSVQFAARAAHQTEDGTNGAGGPGVEKMLLEKDREIEDLRAKLDDQTRMVNALRSAARKREMVDTSPLGNNKDNASKRRTIDEVPAPHAVASAVRSTDSRPESFSSPRSPGSGRRSSRLRNSSSHVSNLSNGSGRSSVGNTTTTTTVVNFSKTPLSPVALLSTTARNSAEQISSPSSALPSPAPVSPAVDPGHRPLLLLREVGATGYANTTPTPAAVAAAARATSPARRRKSVDEMTQLLDQMIQDKVESGQVLRGAGGSLRVKRDTVIDAAPPLSPPRSSHRSGGGAFEGGSGTEIGTLQEVEEARS